MYKGCFFFAFFDKLDVWLGKVFLEELRVTWFVALLLFDFFEKV
jgi:hypothetical protein